MMKTCHHFPEQRFVVNALSIVDNGNVEGEASPPSLIQHTLPVVGHCLSVVVVR